MVKLRRVRESHLSSWGDLYDQFGLTGPVDELPTWPLDNEDQTELVLDAGGNGIEIPKSFDGGQSKSSFVQMLVTAVGREQLMKLLADAGMMVWLAAHYQEALRVYNSVEGHWVGKQKVRFMADSQWPYRQEIEAMLRVHLFFGDDAAVFLDGPMCIRSDAMEQLFATSVHLASPGVVGAYNEIFSCPKNTYKTQAKYGQGQGKPTGFIRGAPTTSKTTNKPGFRYFKVLIERKNRLIDVHALSKEEVIELLGGAFDWTNGGA